MNSVLTCFSHQLHHSFQQKSKQIKIQRQPFPHLSPIVIVELNVVQVTNMNIVLLNNNKRPHARENHFLLSDFWDKNWGSPSNPFSTQKRFRCTCPKSSWNQLKALSVTGSHIVFVQCSKSGCMSHGSSSHYHH